MTQSQTPKTLLVEFAPRKEASRTKQLRRYFTDLINPYTELTELDMCCNAPDYLDGEKVRAYYKRNYQDQKLTPKEEALLSHYDTLRDQLMESDVLIISSPMYNFGYPAAVKAWIDAVMQRQHVYTSDAKGHVPLLSHVKILIIYTSGITFDQLNENEDWNGLEATGARLFEYMGAEEVRVVHVQGTDMLPAHNIEYRTEKVAKPKLLDLASSWYGISSN